jgi:predicted nucleic acid-binding protein
VIYLLDTSVLSERTKARPSPKVMSFLRRLPAADARVPAIVLGEIKQGVQSNPSPALQQFLEDVLTLPVAPFDELEALAWGEMTAAALAQNRTVYVRDSLIAATAWAHRWTVATRNTDDFARLGVNVLNPFEEQV